MKRFFCVIFSLIFIFSSVPFASAKPVKKMTYYIDSVGGDNIPDAYKLAEGSALIGAGLKIEDDLTKDFFGNELTGANIGCYGGSGEKATKNTKDTENETGFEKFRRKFKTTWETLKKEVVKIIEDIGD